MKIVNFHLNRLRNDAHFQHHTEFLSLIARETAAKLDIAAEFTEYQALYNNLDEALKKISKSALTDKIREADKARDDIWDGLMDMNKAALKHFSPEVQDAAKRLKVVFDTYGNVAKKTLNEETSAIHNILQELEGKYASDAAATGIEQWVAELKARKAIDAVYKDICDAINVLARRKGIANYETFINTLNAVIAKYAVKHHRHHHHATAASGQPEGTQNDV